MQLHVKRKIFIGFFLFLALLVGVVITVYLSQQDQDIRQRADELTPTPTDVPACIPDEGTCEWDLQNDATSYHYKITETDSGTVVKEGDVSSPKNSITFTIEQNKAYTCSVTASNDCGTGEPGEATNTCIADATPTPTVEPTPTEGPTPTGEPSPTPTSTPTRTPTPTRIPTPLPTSTPVPQPTNPPPTVIQQTRTVVQENTVVQQQTVVVQATPVPTIPPTGPTEVVVGFTAAAVLGIIGAVIFFIL